MLSFPTQVLNAGAVLVDGKLDPEDKVWLEGDQLPLGEGVKVTGRLSEAGPGRVYFSGTLKGSVTLDCRRCLVQVEAIVDTETHVLFADESAVDEDDPDVLPMSKGRSGSEIDLRPAVRQEWLLEVPALVLCRPACKGLCPKCGANLNQGACACARKSPE